MLESSIYAGSTQSSAANGSISTYLPRYGSRLTRQGSQFLPREKNFFRSASISIQSNHDIRINTNSHGLHPALHDAEFGWWLGSFINNWGLPIAFSKTWRQARRRYQALIHLHSALMIGTSPSVTGHNLFRLVLSPEDIAVCCFQLSQVLPKIAKLLST
ncbi:hypothetical protein BJX64DRAFT_123282 [Aspergillus heterothallicus]